LLFLDKQLLKIPIIAFLVCNLYGNVLQLARDTVDDYCYVIIR
jgi:hypothetical protein